MIHLDHRRRALPKTKTIVLLSRTGDTADAGVVTLKPWFEKYPERFREESEILAAKGFELNHERLAKEGRVEFQGRSAKQPARQLIVQFPHGFPSFPPRIFDTPENQLLRRHQRGDTREICLFGPAAARWFSRLTVKDALAEAEELIETFGAAGLTEVKGDDVPEPVTALLPYTAGAFILVPPTVAKLRPDKEGERTEGRFDLEYRFDEPTKFHGSRGRGVAVAARFEQHANDTIFRQFIHSGPAGSGIKIIKGRLFYYPNPLTQGELAAELTAIFQKAFSKRRERDAWAALAVPEQSGSAGTSRLSWIVARGFPDNRYDVIRTSVYVPAERQARIPSVSGVENKTVAIVGAGCLGSQIAVCLAASGVHRFVLIDPDHLEPYNAVRHDLGVDAFGYAKVLGLAQRLFVINPTNSANIRLCTHRVGDETSTEASAEVVELVRSADIVVDTTGLHRVSRHLNELCYEFKIPSLYVSVTQGAWGGEIVRVIPGRTACWLCWNEQYAGSQPPADPSVQEGFFAPGCEQPSFTGTKQETGVVATVATSVVCDTLLRATGEKQFTGDYFRWSARDEHGKAILKWDLLPIKHRGLGCSLCSVD